MADRNCGGKAVNFRRLLGVIIRGFSGPPASEKDSREACLDDAWVNYLDEQSMARYEEVMRFERQPRKTFSSSAFHADVNLQDSFEHLSDEDDDEGILDVNDPAVPEIVRDHGRRFRNPAKYVVPLGNDEYVLFGEDGEVLDGVWLKNQA